MPKRSLQVSAVVRLFLALWLAITPTFVWAGSMTLLGVGGPAAGGGPYVGPGNVVSGATHWYGLRGYSAAYATGTNPAVDLLDQAGANPITINIKSDGTLDVASISTWVAAHTVTTIKVTKIYDQVGTNHATQATLASMPNLVLGPVTGLASNRPAMVFSGGQVLTFVLSVVQPITMSTVAIRTSGTADVGVMAGDIGNDAEMIFHTANVVEVFAGSAVASQSQTDNAWHALHGVFNGASSVMNVDGSSGTANNVGSTGITNNARIGEDSFGDFLTGDINEAGLWPSALSGANMSSLSSNQHSYWGF